ncbi:ABC transporter permease subunit [Agrobacterium vitis]|uniref:ABC transporter permease n=1 Tax=Agrobacterium vitis TaxID=373 RepID=A0A368P1V5_AGRVI|nr:ABC transporter permease [Agrobacterium vitis]KAA3518585.1 ABC transporter permease [Agrobacterium vitis]KAA3530181.1 ABC transporter permease [Agrobacterium vitis]MCF1476442.1 ABC transporter permease [Agrobacterium vitis]MUZ71725.1 ABC transporter permease subunit [Agrobacterium vitis]MUZ96362.1 ABC transporter permease subunit [Agrobacterium vitis]
MTTTVTTSKPSSRRPAGLFLRPTLLIGGLIIILLVAIALLSLVWTPLPPTRMQIIYKLKPPLVHGLLGTDQLGRDLTSMLMVGAWNSLSTAMAAVVLGAGVGTLFGVTVAARRGMVEALTMRINDVIFAIPPILSAMMLGALLGTGRFTAIIAIAVFMVPVFARVTASAALQVWSRDYVLAARAAGKGQVLITIEHVLPNIASQIIVQIAIQLGLAILTEAGLSFLGLGMPPPAPTWGRMLADSQTYLAAAPWLAILPGLAIALTVLGFNMLGDGLRDLLDPREKGRS